MYSYIYSFKKVHIHEQTDVHKPKVVHGTGRRMSLAAMMNAASDAYKLQRQHLNNSNPKNSSKGEKEKEAIRYIYFEGIYMYMYTYVHFCTIVNECMIED